MDKELLVTLTKCRNGQPLALIRNLPGEGAEMRPEAMRALAMALLQAATDCERKPNTKGAAPEKRTYSLARTCSTPFFNADYLEKSRAERESQRALRLEKQIQRSLGK